MATWTIDVEYDWGGRTNGTIGIEQGIPLILKEFSRRKITGTFFISTELLRDFRRTIRDIKERGHIIGSHGHFHIKYREAWRAEEDRLLSNSLLLPYTSGNTPYRAPKFFHHTDDKFSTPRNHTGLLKHVWLGDKIRDIIYLHPFDIVEHGKAPTLFTHFWYSRPQSALRLFKKLCLQYS